MSVCGASQLVGRDRSAAAVPPALIERTVQLLVGIAAGTVPPAIDHAASGVLKAMFLTKLKELAGAIGLVLLVTGGFAVALARSGSTENPPGARDARSRAAVIVTESKLTAPVPQPAAPVPVPKESAWKTEFRKAYGLSDSVLFRRVPPPYPDCRAEYFKNRLREFAQRNKLDLPADELNQDRTDYFTKFGWKDGGVVDRLTMQNTPVKPDDGVRLVQLLHMTTGFGHTRTEGDAGLLEEKVTGDFVVRAGADPEKVAVTLEKILRKECHLQVSLTVKEVERAVYVVSGNRLTSVDSGALFGRRNKLVHRLFRGYLCWQNWEGNGA
jgi:hypothetical protein